MARGRARTRGTTTAGSWAWARAPRTCPTRPSGRVRAGRGRLRDRDLLAEVHVLDGAQQAHAFGQRPLERLAPRDEAHASRALVDDGGLDRLREVVLAGRPPGV